jgi:tetratricopeptide (TPR) repeat protein
MFRHRFFVFVLISLTGIFCGIFGIGEFFGKNAFGQGAMPAREIPTQEYFAISLHRCFEGNFDKALADFNHDLQRAVKIPNVNGQMFLWLDSLCYWVMCGECHYQTARYDDAMQAFNNALQIYLQQPEWLKNITYAGNPSLLPRQPFVWGRSERTGAVGDFRHCKFQIYQENINLVNLSQLGHQGTALTKNAQLSSIHADEIVSRMALMIRRRSEILGALSKYDPETKLLLEVLGNRPCLPNHFTGAWVDVLHGLTLAAMGDDASAETQLQKGLLMLGQLDHHLTPVALNELGNIAVRANKPEEAVKHYLESSFSAYLARDPILLGETFRNMANAQRLIDKTKTYPPLQAALNFFGMQKDVSPMILVPLCHELAEDAFTAGNAKAAITFYNQAAALLKGRNMADTVHGARNYYLGAMIAYATASADYQNGKPMNLAIQNGDKNLETALLFMRQRGSLWLYQLNILETLFQQGKITTRGPITMRIADELYDFLLRDPNTLDWMLQPMESLAAMTFTPPTAFQRWFYVALQRGDREKAFEISERARRAVFFSSFNLGARLFSLRILFEGGNANIPPERILERQTLSLDFAGFGELSNQVRAVRTQLQSVPLVPQNPAQIEQQRKLLRELETLSLAQEAMLRSMALTRTRTSNIFPPVMTLEQIRKELPEKTAMLVFTESLGTLYGFLIDSRNLTMWTIIQEPKTDSLSKLITDYLTGLGNRDINYQLTVKDLSDPNGKWKEAGSKLLNRLLGNEPRPVQFTELVIVPTGQLWYVPFESMTVKTGADYRPLIAAGREPLTIRYAPTASLGIPRKTGRSVAAETLAVYGKLVSKDSPEAALNAIDRYVKAGIQHLIPMPAITNEPFPSSASAFAAQIKQLLILDDIPIPANGLPLSWSPFNADRAKLKNSVASWLTLPWGGPELIILPGFHTPAEFSLKSPRSGSKPILNGEDLFLSAMTLQACGAQTILLSRWRTGGRASYDLVEEFLKNYSRMASAESWRQAVMTVGGEALHLDEEPRVRTEAGVEPPMANHPFFWGAFMLIDSGDVPENQDSGISE